MLCRYSVFTPWNEMRKRRRKATTKEQWEDERTVRIPALMIYKRVKNRLQFVWVRSLTTRPMPSPQMMWWCSHISSFSWNLARGHKTGYNKRLDVRKQTKQYVHRSTSTQRERYYNDLSYTTPYHLLRDDTRNITVVHTYTRKRTRKDCYTTNGKKGKKGQN